MDTCIRVKDHEYMHHSYLHYRHMHQDQGYICIVDTCIVQIFIGIKDQIYVYHTYMHHGQGSRVIDTCNISLPSIAIVAISPLTYSAEFRLPGKPSQTLAVCQLLTS